MSASRWLADVLFNAPVADTYPVFTVHNQEVLGMLGLPQADKRDCTFDELRPTSPRSTRRARSPRIRRPPSARRSKPPSSTCATRSSSISASRAASSRRTPPISPRKSTPMPRPSPPAAAAVDQRRTSRPRSSSTCSKPRSPIRNPRPPGAHAHRGAARRRQASMTGSPPEPR